MKWAITFFGVLAIAVFAGCLKQSNSCPYSTSPVNASEAESLAIQSYLDANSIVAVKHTSGFYYQILSVGNGSAPNLCSTVKVKYQGMLFDGTVFDSNTQGASFVLGGLIVGWQKGLPLIKPGGKVRLYLPPSMAYGKSAVGSIPANSYLIFEVELLEVS